MSVEMLAIVWHGLLLLLQVTLLLAPPPPCLGKARSLIGVLGAEAATAVVLLVGNGPISSWHPMSIGIEFGRLKREEDECQVDFHVYRVSV